MSPKLLLDRGVALYRQGRRAEALLAFDETIRTAPDFAPAHSNRARLLVDLGRNDEAIAAADAALTLDSTLEFAWRARSEALLALDRTAEAVEGFRRALSCTPAASVARAQADLGRALLADRHPIQAIQAFDAAHAAGGGWPARLMRSQARLLLHDFGGGWDDYESRYRPGVAFGNAFGLMSTQIREALLFDPRPATFERARVLVVGEQGLGDQIMFGSVLPDVVAVAAQVTCVVEPRLHTLFQHAFPTIHMVWSRGPTALDLSPFDCVVAMGSLPAAFRRSKADFPGAPYLSAKPDRVSAWRERLGPRGARYVGLSWRGGVDATRAVARSMPLETLRPLLERPDCTFVSLQYGEASAEIAAMNATLARPVLSFERAELDDFESLAALVEALDEVVTVQTTLAHLAGALGRPALVMIPRQPEWRYGVAGERMLWYNSLTLLRQADDAGWPPVIAEVGRRLDRVPGRP